MAIRHLARQRALQLLYGLEFNGLPFDEAVEEFLRVNAKRRKGWSEFARALARGAFEQREQLDRDIAPLLRGWTIERIPLMDRLCLRMALCELREFADIPLRVTLDEYVELAKMYGTEESPGFVNAVLDRLAADFRHKDNENVK